MPIESKRVVKPVRTNIAESTETVATLSTQLPPESKSQTCHHSTKRMLVSFVHTKKLIVTIGIAWSSELRPLNFPRFIIKRREVQEQYTRLRLFVFSSFPSVVCPQ